ncbi:YcbK family protein [Budviciaceae bacterium CWB-B4]|uniref:Murein endopeptidase K n=1 Tax=Limnobaculum xujianqingii TaxID=2738837 RepID=A0A9D7AJH9_9GAMM|nr:YcbK family protein [Limnobaculum xujianqingii]MBK5073807.1 YcbK family protein [Limnobaculum xujianqingii]MBK5177299.1 YcbK family protein [Limnobaculum xujianqingii]
MDKIDHHRRKWLAISGAALGLALIPDAAFAASSTSTTKKSKSALRTRTLLVKNINTNETIKSTYFNGKSYDKTELSRLNHIFRDRRNDQITTIDPQLYDKLHYLQKQFGNKQIELICGYRSVDSNNSMRSQKRGVAKHSYHTLGQAADIRIDGVSLKSLRDAALQMKSGGVGYYPSSNFVHVDTGPVRDW